MRTVIQRVSRASVTVDGQVTGAIGRGLLVLVGISKDDRPQDADYLVDKIAGLRIFPDENDKMNLSVAETGGALLVVSQFTLYGDVRKGRHPAFDRAGSPEAAKLLYDYFVSAARARGIHVETGVFQAMMKVDLVNEGPVTILCDSEKLM